MDTDVVGEAEQKAVEKRTGAVLSVCLYDGG